MRIAIIGTGNVGSALARRLAGSGHAVTLGTRDASRPGPRVLAAATGAALASPRAAVADADLVILALPWSATEMALLELGSLAGKIVVDCMNPLAMAEGRLGLTLGHTTSGGEMVAGWLPGARVVKTLNQVGAEVIAGAADFPRRPVMLMAGDDDDAKATVTGLLGDLGFDSLDAGGLAQARLLEPFGMLWINQAMARGKGRQWAFAVVEGGGGCRACRRSSPP